MESNAVEVRFFSKKDGHVTKGLQQRKFLFALPKNVSGRHELKEGSVVAVNNQFGYAEPAVIVGFKVIKRTYDLKRVVGNYRSDYYGLMEEED